MARRGEWIKVTMEDRDVYKLFLRVLEHPGQNTEDIRRVFSVLVRSTLKYRDHMLESEGIIVTVEDVRTALGWLVPSLLSGQLPETNSRVRLGLLEIWIDELRQSGIAH